MDFSLSGGTQVMGFISPFDTNDSYAVIDPLYGIDGLRNVASLTEMNAIPDARRREGMTVGVKDVSGTTYYLLNSSPWSGVTGDWTSGYTINDSGEFIIENVHITNLFGASPITVYDNLQYDSNVASGDKSTAFGSGNTVSGDYSFVNSLNSIVSGNRSILLGGQNLTGDTDDTLYVPNIRVFNDMVIDGSVTINGTATTINTEILLVEDNLITLNSTFTAGTPSVDAGIEILRGSGTTSQLLWDESTNRWYAGLSGNTAQILLSTDGTGNFTGNTSGTCIDDIYVSNIYGCSPVQFQTPITIGSNPTLTANTYTNTLVVGNNNNSVGVISGSSSPYSGTPGPIHTENFDGAGWDGAGGTGSGWSTVGNVFGSGNFGIGPVGDCQSCFNPSSTGYDGASGGNYLEMIDWSCSFGTEILVFSGISTVGLTDVSVMWGGYDGDNNLIPTTEISNDGISWTGLTYTEVTQTGTWELINGGVPIQFPANALNQPQVRFRWSYVDLCGFSLGYDVDDLVFSTLTGVTSGSSGVLLDVEVIDYTLINGNNNVLFGTNLSGVTVLGNSITADTSDRIYLGNEITIPNITTASTSGVEVMMTVPSSGGTISYKTYDFSPTEFWSAGTATNSVVQYGGGGYASGDTSFAVNSGFAYGDKSFASGLYTIASGDHSFVGGAGVVGGKNIASGHRSFSFQNVSLTNKPYGTFATDSVIIGGSNSIVDTDASSSVIVGGGSHIISGSSSSCSIIGGGTNLIDWGGRSGIFAGLKNIISGVTNSSRVYGSAIIGGEDNTIQGISNNGWGDNPNSGDDENIIAGGNNNLISGLAHSSTVFGGNYNEIDNSYYSSILGGRDNFIGNSTAPESSIILGGRYNIMNGSFGTIIGGYQNTVNDLYSVLGGRDNITTGNYGVGFGDNNSVGQYSFVQGLNSVGTGSTSVALGESVSATSQYSFAQGLLNLSSGVASHVEGRESNVYGDGSHAENIRHEVWNHFSHVEGINNLVSGSKPFISGVTDTIVEDIVMEVVATLRFAYIVGGNRAELDGELVDIWESRIGQVFTVYGGDDPPETFTVGINGAVTQGIFNDIRLRSGNVGDLTGSTHIFISGSSVTGITQTAGYHVGGHAEGSLTWSSGKNTHVGGAGFNEDNRVIGSGQTSFAHFEITGKLGHLGTYADNSAILGGINHMVLSAATGSTIFGGAGITADTADTVYVPNLVINTTPVTDESIDNILIRDTDGTVKMRSSQSLSLDFTGNTSGNCIDDIYVSNLYGCSPINFHTPITIGSNPTLTANTYTNTLVVGGNNVSQGVISGATEPLTGTSVTIFSENFDSAAWGNSTFGAGIDANTGWVYVGSGTFDSSGTIGLLDNGCYYCTISPSDTYAGASAGDGLEFVSANNFGTVTVEYSGVTTMGADSFNVIWGAADPGTDASPNGVPVAEISNDGISWTGLTYTEVTPYGGWSLINGGAPIQFPANALNQPQVRFRFRIEDNNSASDGYYVDDITFKAITGATNGFSGIVLDAEVIDYTLINGNNNVLFGTNLSGVTIFGSSITADTSDRIYLGNEISIPNITTATTTDTEVILTVPSDGGVVSYKTVSFLWSGGTGNNSINKHNNNSTATGDNSLAIGSGSTASGNNSITLGENSTASGNGSIAVGTWSVASGLTSFAGGNGSSGNKITASGVGSFAFGNSGTGIDANADASAILGGTSHLVDSNSDDSVIIGGVGDSILNSTQSAIVGGGTNVVSGTTFSVIIGGEDNTVTGANNSVILGGNLNNIEVGSNGSTILGGNTNLIGIYGVESAILGGNNNRLVGASAVYPTRFKENIIAGGNNNEIRQNGDNVQVSNNTILNGYDNLIGGIGSTILGGSGNLISGGTFSTILNGFANILTALYSLSHGTRVEIVSGSYSTAFGEDITSVGSHKLTVGDQLISTGDTSTLIGRDSNSHGDNSFTHGAFNDNYGHGSSIQGIKNISNNHLSHIEGYHNISNSLKPFISGVTTTVVVPIAYMRVYGAGFAPILSGNTGNPYDDFGQNDAIWNSRIGQTFTVYGGSDPNETFVLDRVNEYTEMGTSTLAGQIYLRAVNQTDITGTTHQFMSGSSVTGITQIAGSLVGGHAQGRYVNAGGNWSHAAGKGLDDWNRVVALGDTSFAHFEVTEDNGPMGAYADNSAILGGINNHILSGATGSTVFGGAGITATTPDTTYVPNLNIDTTPTLDKTADTLAIDSNGKVVKLDNRFTILPSLTGATWDLSTDSLNAEITLTGNTTLTISGVSNGDEGILKVVQDGVGSHTISIPANSKVAKGGGGVVTLTTALNSIDIIRFRYDGTDFLWDVFDDYT